MGGRERDRKKRVEMRILSKTKAELEAGNEKSEMEILNESGVDNRQRTLRYISLSMKSTNTINKIGNVIFHVACSITRTRRL